MLWIAMEHVRGMTLDELVAQRGPIPASVFAPLFARLCEVVHSAHELGIVHRDIKGANVMVIERAGQLLPKLLDFGIAKSDAADVVPGVDVGELTAHGVMLGSPHYMSAEQWQRPSEVDARADIYALGVLGHRCLAGYLPFHSLARGELAEAHTQHPVPPLPEFVPAPLAAVVMRALAKNREERWQTAVAFAEAVQRVAGAAPAAEAVPLFDPATRDAWLRAGPQPIADAVAHLSSATTTVEADAALRELIAITCRWLAVLALAGQVKLYAGRTHLGDYPASDLELAVAYDPGSGRSAITGPLGVHVFERGTLIAKTAKRGATAFADPGHLWLAEPDQQLWQWTLATNAWEAVMRVGEVYAVAAMPGKVVLGTRKGQLIVVDSGREFARLELGEPIGDIVPSADHRWLAAHLATGATTIVDSQTWQVARKLAPADNYGAAPTFDATGELLLRLSRNALTIWDRATGEELVFGFDMLQQLSNGRFLPDGRIELDRREPGLLDIPRDTRPIADVVKDIDCKVPLEVVGSRLQPRSPTYP